MVSGKKIKKYILWAFVALALIFSREIYYLSMYGVYIVRGHLNQPSGTCAYVPIDISQKNAEISCKAIVPNEANFKLSIILGNSSEISEQNKKQISEIRSKLNISNVNTRGKDGSIIQPSIPLHAFFSVVNDANGEVVKGDVRLPPVAGYSVGTIRATLMTIRLTPGTYTITVHVDESDPKLKEIPIKFNFGLSMPK